MKRLLLRGGSVVDGSGAPAFAGDVLIEDGRIAAVGRVQAPDAEVVECAGLTVAPGFIDGHSHSDLQVLEERPEKVRQGVTTEVVGNCGFSAYPAAADRSALHDFGNGILHGHGDWGWRSAGDYLDAVRARANVGVVSLVGHGTLRIAAGNSVDVMCGVLDECLAEGAGGFSTGLMYAPGSEASAEELERLCAVAARRGRVYATHMRDYGFRLEEAVEEQLGLARKTGCRLQISHLQAVGPANWGRQRPALNRIERAREAGVDVAFDCYPYVAGSTVLSQLLPQWALEGGSDGLVARLTDPGIRGRIAAETIAGMAHRWTDLFISAVGSERNRAVIGRDLQEIAVERGCEPIDAVFDLLVEERGAVNMLEFNQSEENLRQALTHPLSNVISDGFYVSGRPHPRLNGTFPRLLGWACREKGWMSLPEAVRKITGRPAERFGLRDRGLVREGMAADLVVFDAERVGSPATYAAPERGPEGIRLVLRGGEALPIR
jgi:dihydroorotase/N-acyl-D-amino-acid deacylase